MKKMKIIMEINEKAKLQDLEIIDVVRTKNHKFQNIWIFRK